MTTYADEYLRGFELSAAMTAELDGQLRAHFRHNGKRQEDLTFALWRPSIGSRRFTAILDELVLPRPGECILTGNVSFTADYLSRVLASVPKGCSVAVLHSHLGPGWQDTSRDDDVAERDRLASAVAGRTGLPVLGLTWGTDGTWSGRFWARRAPFTYVRLDVPTVRVAGRDGLAISYHPALRPPPASVPAQQATVSVWGRAAQEDITRTRVGIVGLGSVGSIVAEALSRLGVTEIVLIDPDHIEQRNLDRTMHATSRDAAHGTSKVTVAERGMADSHTAQQPSPRALPINVLTPEGVTAVLDCDVMVSCVDRPLPRWLLNTIAYAHLIPVIDGGIMARVMPNGRPLHIDWRIHTVGPGRACLVCLGALLRSDVALDRDGLLDDPDYLQGLSEHDRERYNRRNVFPFSLSVAAHQVLQLIGVIAGNSRVGGIGTQHYAAYPGEMTVTPTRACDPDCETNDLIATAMAIETSHLRPAPVPN
jgi:molybdopterin-synthase adenylyltransferase